MVIIIDLPTITLTPQKCYRDHVFYPKIKNGIVILFNRCPVRSCRVFLSSQPRNKRDSTIIKVKRKRTTIAHYCHKGHVFFPFVDDSGNVIKLNRCPVNGCRVILGQHPQCTICNIILWDNANLIAHNRRLHPVLLVG